MIGVRVGVEIVELIRVASVQICGVCRTMMLWARKVVKVLRINVVEAVR